LEPPGGHHRSGGLYHVTIHLVLPEGREVTVGRTPAEDERHGNVMFAIDDAFRRARRRLQDEARRMRSQVKEHAGQPIGTVLRFDRANGFGFIAAPDGHEVYFHQNSVVAPLRRIAPGVRVTFVEEQGEEGPQASTVRVLGKHGLRHDSSAGIA
jgi:cold shock CspA family protein